MNRTQKMMEDIPLAGGLAAAAVTDTMGKAVNPELARNEEQHELMVDVKEIFDQVAQQGGVIPATLLNMHPWEIRSTGPHNEGIVIPACPIDDEFVAFHQRTFRRDFGDRWGKFKVRPVWPIMMMRDVAKQHEQWGGIVVYMGDNVPGTGKSATGGGVMAALEKLFRSAKDEDKPLIQYVLDQQAADTDTKYASEREIIAMMESQARKRLDFYEKRFEACEGAIAANTKSAWNSITPMDRQMARWLLKRGRYKTAPKWLTEKRAQDWVQAVCKKCGVDVDVSKGYACGKCSYIHNGILAYSQGDIDATDIALKRHTREELDAAGLTHIKTLAEERESLKQPKKNGKTE